MALQIAAFLLLAVITSRVPVRRLATGLSAVLLLEAGALWFTWNPTVKPQEARPELPEVVAAGRLGGDARVIGIGAPNLATLYGMRDIDGYDLASRSVGRYHRLLGSSEGIAGFVLLSAKNRIPVPAAANILSARLVLVWPGLQPPLPGMVLVRDGPVRLYLNPAALRRARLVGDLVVEPEPDVVLAQIRAQGFDPATRVIVDRTPSPEPQPGGGSATITRDEAAEITVETDATGPRILVLADTAAPGWRARLDGKPVPLLTAYARVRAVAVPAGRHVVAMSYRPPGFVLGLIASIAAALSLLATVLWDRSRRQGKEAVRAARQTKIDQSSDLAPAERSPRRARPAG